MNREGGPTILAEEASNLIRNTLCANEDEDLVLLVVHDLLEMLDHTITLLHVSNDLDNLGDTVVGSKLHRTDVDLDEVVEEVGSQGADLGQVADHMRV